MTGVELAESLTEIGDWAFYGCGSLKRVDLPNGIAVIGNYTFNGCGALTYVGMPKNVKSIGDYAFSGCIELKDVVLPKSLRDIGEKAFEGCSQLGKAYYESSKDDWLSVAVEPNSFEDNIVLCFYSEDMPTDTEGSYWRYGVDGLTVLEW